MDPNLLQFDISDEASLLEAFSLLHDARMDPGTVEFDVERHLWKARFVREFLDDPNLMRREPRFLIFTRTTFPWVVTELTLRGVKSCSVKEDQGIGEHMFNDCHIRGSVAELLFCELMTITLELDSGLQGRLADTEVLLNRTGSFWSLGRVP